MALLPAYCRNCGYIFGSIFDLGEGTKNIKFVGFKNIQCERCGEIAAEMVEGSFEVVDGLIQIVSAPLFTLEVLRRFQGIVEQARAGDLSSPVAVQQAEALAPGLGSYLDKILQHGIPACMLLVMLIQTFFQHAALQLQAEQLKLDQESGQGVGRQFDELIQTLRGLAPGFNKSIARPIQPQFKGLRPPKTNHHERVKNRGAAPADAKNNTELMSAKGKSQRRKEVNLQRRANLKARRMARSGRVE